MSFSLHQAAIAPCLQMFGSLSGVLKKGASYAAERKIDPAALLQARLYPDMFPLTRQVQIASDGAKAGAARLAGVDVPSWPDTETSFEELEARIARSVAFLQGLDPAAIDGAATRSITFKAGKRELTMTGADYVTGWMLPNFFFHVTTAYDILRHNGLAVGKMDFLGAVPAKVG